MGPILTTADIRRHFRLHPDQNQRTWDRRRAAQQQVAS